MQLPPRVVVAGTSSGVGKTTVAVGLMAALTAAGHRVAGAKVGPDFIDPGYHALACGRPPRNLDAWLCGPDAIPSLAARAGVGTELLVVEGVMGLFDGASDGTASSTADLARMLGAPVLLVVDASAVSGSIAATVHGFATFDPSVEVAGVVLNLVGSDGHEQLLREAVAPLGIPVVGVLRRDDRLRWRDRHLGLVPVAEAPDAVTASLAVLGAAVTASFDLAAVVRLAGRAHPLAAEPPAVPVPGRPIRVGVAGGRAFTFTYQDTLDALEAGGAEVVPFDPLHDAELPEALDGLLAGGGFPEVFGSELAANRPMLAAVRAAVDEGLPTWAECGGLLWLCRSLDGHALAGVVDAEASMGDRLVLGYRSAVTEIASPLGSAGTRLRGHEFHYAATDPVGAALTLDSRFGRGPSGFATPTLLASFLHHHPGGDPGPIEAFLGTCRARRGAAGADQ